MADANRSPQATSHVKHGSNANFTSLCSVPVVFITICQLSSIIADMYHHRCDFHLHHLKCDMSLLSTLVTCI